MSKTSARLPPMKLPVLEQRQPSITQSHQYIIIECVECREGERHELICKSQKLDNAHAHRRPGQLECKGKNGLDEAGEMGRGSGQVQTGRGLACLDPKGKRMSQMGFKQERNMIQFTCQEHHSLQMYWAGEIREAPSKTVRSVRSPSQCSVRALTVACNEQMNGGPTSLIIGET